MDSATLLLHPVRLRIVRALLGGRRMTTSELAAELPEVSAATVYRQVATLADAGVLVVVEEERIRGAVQRTYALDTAAAQVRDEDLAAMTAEDHRRAFTAFVAGLLADFDRYLVGDPHPRRDLVGYRTAALWLTDDELVALASELSAAVTARLDLGPGEGRTRRLLSTVLMPDRG
jgi:DNA-binding transcriptional ArsR family regulator